MEFKHQFNGRKRRVANAGSRIKTKYSGHYDEKGRVILEECGTENLYDYIQSFKESCDIHVLLKRYVNGDTDALARVQGFYADITEMPNTLAGALNVVNDTEAFFDTLPVEMRAKFGHNFGQFLASVGDGSMFDILGIQKPTPEPVPEVAPADPVKEVTSE